MTNLIKVSTYFSLPRLKIPKGVQLFGLSQFDEGMFSFGNFETKLLFPKVQLLKVLSKQHGGGLSSSWQEDLHVVVRAVPGVRSKSLLAQSSDLRAQDSFKILPLSHFYL